MIVDLAGSVAVTRSAVLLLAAVLGTAAVVASFSRRSLDLDARTTRYFAFIGVLTSGSTVVVLPGPSAALLVGWVASGAALVALVGHERRWPRAAQAQRLILRNLLTGDVALFLALVVIGLQSSGSPVTDTGAVVDDLRTSSIAGIGSIHVVAILLVIAGASRSALFPFHRWLLGTLAAPTPVSALVHAGLVSGAGLLFVRFGGVILASDVAVVAAFTLAVTTLVLATVAGLFRADAKGTLAWSTVGQMAFMVVQCTVGALSSAVFHIAGHGMYKASLFLGVGDTAAAGLRSRRRPGPATVMSPIVRLGVAVVLGAGAVAVTIAVIPPDVNDAGTALVVIFAWLSIVSGLHGWLARGPFTPVVASVSGGVGAVLASAAYLGGLRLVEQWMKPDLDALAGDTAIGVPELLVVVAAFAVVAVMASLPGPVGRSIRTAAYWMVMWLAEPAPPQSPGRTTGDGDAEPAPAWIEPDPARRAEIAAEVSSAAAVIAPSWPLESFVAVNPLGGLESHGFDEATSMARRWLGTRTHLSLSEFRADHESGLTTRADLEHSVLYHLTDVSSLDHFEAGGRTISPLEVLVADLLHAPEPSVEAVGNTELQRCEGEPAEMSAHIDDILSSWLAQYVGTPAWRPVDRGPTFVEMGLRLMKVDPRVRRIGAADQREFVASVRAEPTQLIDAALSSMGIPDERRIDELRGNLARLPGWAGLAKWRNEWAQPDETRPPLAPIDVVAVRVALEAVAVAAIGGPAGDRARESTSPVSIVEAPRAERVDAVVGALGVPDDDRTRRAVAEILGHVPETQLPSLWLSAQERNFDGRMLALLDRVDPGPRLDRPDAQAVFCIDVRSEGLRRHLEMAHRVETIGFAGFFGVPMRIRHLGWDHTEPRCPVLVAPAITASESPLDDAIVSVAGEMSRARAVGALKSAHDAAKRGIGAPFALAETAGWLVGPDAARRTFGPPRSTPLPERRTRMVLDDDEVLHEQRVFFAESALRTMGLTDRFAPIVLLCGHTSRTVNNPHATALECGACAGAAGDDNARAVAALLNSADVRHGLVERGIEIPDDTWFVAGLHDTAADRVTFLDTALVPESHRRPLDELGAALEEAGSRQAGDRAVKLRASDADVRDRGADWAQIRPEWGLAGNAAFIIGPRSMTSGLDLDGRAFLHEYDADADETGKVLETIMTAPLVVGHWISSQYYFSTVDPERLGAGDKLLHNPIGTTGVISGAAGDLRVGLPLQSTHAHGERFHQPLRLLAVIQADLERIERIIAENPILQTLTRGSWLRIAGRSHAHEPWSTRTAAGTWITNPRPISRLSTLARQLETT